MLVQHLFSFGFIIGNTMLTPPNPQSLFALASKCFLLKDAGNIPLGILIFIDMIVTHFYQLHIQQIFHSSTSQRFSVGFGSGVRFWKNSMLYSWRGLPQQLLCGMVHHNAGIVIIRWGNCGHQGTIMVSKN